MTTRTTPDPRTEAAWLAGLPIAALRSLREVVAENITDAERLLTDADDVAGEVACLAVVDAEIATRTPDCCSNVDGSHWDGCDCTCHTENAACLAVTGRIVAEDRAESDDCQRLTPGCSIDHTAEAQRDRTADSPCETW